MPTAQVCKKNVILLSLFFTQMIAHSESVFPKELEETKSIEIGELILILLPDQGDALVGWDHRTKSPIRWITAGYETHKIDNGESLYYRDGIVRTNIGGISSKILRQDKVELGWTVSYINKSNPKFGVENIDLRPGTPKDVCFGTTQYGCYFDAPLKSLAAASVSVKLICTKSLGSEIVSAYELSHPNKRSTVLRWTTSGGSGGKSSDLSLLLTDDASPSVCALPQVNSEALPLTPPNLESVKSPIMKTNPSNSYVAGDGQLIYDTEDRDRRAIFNHLLFGMENCMRSGSVAMLRQGARERSQIVSFTVGACGQGFTQYLTQVVGRPEAETKAFVIATAHQALEGALASK